MIALSGMNLFNIVYKLEPRIQNDRDNTTLGDHDEESHPKRD